MGLGRVGAALHCVASRTLALAWSLVIRIVLAPDSYKGSLGAPQVCAALREGLQRVWADADIRTRPMADGGEGTLDAVLSAVGHAGSRRQLKVRGADGRPMDAAYGMLDSPAGATAASRALQNGVD